jgi:hypothetical protein
MLSPCVAARRTLIGAGLQDNCSDSALIERGGSKTAAFSATRRCRCELLRIAWRLFRKRLQASLACMPIGE